MRFWPFMSYAKWIGAGREDARIITDVWDRKANDGGQGWALCIASPIQNFSATLGKKAGDKSIRWHVSRLRLHLLSQLILVLRELRLDLLDCLALPDDFLAIPPQEVVDGLDANLDRT